MKKLVCICLICSLLLSACSLAMAQAVFLPELEGLNGQTPLELLLHADVKAHMPYDDDRLAQFNALFRHLGLRIRYQAMDGEAWSHVDVLVDDEAVAALDQRETADGMQAQFSCLPDDTYAWNGADGLSLTALLDDQPTYATLFGLDGTEEAWLNDGLALLEAMTASMPEFLKESKNIVNIENMGRSAVKQVLTIPAESAGALAAQLTAIVPEGKLRALLSTLTFSGKQTITLWRSSDGAILRADWTGKTGVSQEDMRNVSLTWKLRRDDQQVRDQLTLRTPRVTGSGRNNVVFSRILKQSEKGSTLKSNLTYEQVVQGKKSILTAEMDLARTVKAGNATVTGSMTVKQQRPDKKDADRIVIKPDVSFTPEGGNALASGVVSVSQYEGSRLEEQADVRLELRQGSWMFWELRPNIVKVNETNVDALRQRVLNGLTVDLVRRLVLLPQEDTLFLSAGIDPTTWNQIVEAAQKALQ